MEQINYITQRMDLFFLIFARITGFFISVPVFSQRQVPLVAKVGMSFFLTFILLPLMGQVSILLPTKLGFFVIVLGGEMLVGIAIGFISSLLFSVMQMAGQLIDMQIGFGMVNVLDPNSGTQVPLVGNFNHLLAMLIFLIINGHHQLILSLYKSYEVIPLMGVGLSNEVLGNLIAVSGKLFVISFKIAAPVIGAILIADVAFGIMARTVPQMNIFVVGIPAKILIGLFIIFLSIPLFVSLLPEFIDNMMRDIFSILRGLR